MSQDKRRQSGFTRRKFMKSAAAGAASAAGGKMLATPAQAKTNQHPDPDVILINGKIHTMDAKNRIASSVAIKNGRFIEVERGRPNEIVVPLQDVLHTFRKGHRIMIQIQSTWFPLVDRNPQSWTKNPLLAPASAFVKATHRVHRSKTHASRVELKVLQ